MHLKVHIISNKITLAIFFWYSDFKNWQVNLFWRFLQPNNFWEHQNVLFVALTQCDEQVLAEKC